MVGEIQRDEKKILRDNAVKVSVRDDGDKSDNRKGFTLCARIRVQMRPKWGPYS